MQVVLVFARLADISGAADVMTGQRRQGFCLRLECPPALTRLSLPSASFQPACHASDNVSEAASESLHSTPIPSRTKSITGQIDSFRTAP
ncbi:hypothetical protein N657DRAFT_136137 [Parathielavia appendiculata]|uniref:Uncharacterized protein n=1 Tax=Parathielavia appendiculata TaxID=2587402 RepID=A0AAN6Z167_9PEZI|nr:hypothetical protein N657DRAFT_136137 [Parathielavia appendiculata]